MIKYKYAVSVQCDLNEVGKIIYDSLQYDNRATAVQSAQAFLKANLTKDSAQPIIEMAVNTLKWNNSFKVENEDLRLEITLITYTNIEREDG